MADQVDEDEIYAKWRENHPAVLDAKTLLEGFKASRMLSIDIGQIRLVYLLLEVHGRLTVREVGKKKLAGSIAARVTRDAEEDLDEAETTISRRLAKGPTAWFEEAAQYAGQVNILAVYVLNLRRKTCQSWVHPQVEQNEVLPMGNILSSVTHLAAQLRMDAVPRYTFQEQFDEAEANLERAYFTAKYINKCFTPPDNRASKEKRGYDMLALNRSLVHLNMLPELAPVHLYNCQVYIENQPDIVRQFQYLMDRNEGTAQAFALAIGLAENDEIRLKIMELYSEHVGEEFMHRGGRDEASSKHGPINWGIQQMVVTVLQTVSRMYGHLEDRPILFTMSKGVADYVKDKAAHMLKPNGVPSAAKRYEIIKTASVSKWKPLIEKKRDMQPSVYGSLWTFAQAAVVPGRAHPDKPKLDDITDPLGQALVAFEEFTRATPYRASNDPEMMSELSVIEQAARQWKQARSPVSVSDVQRAFKLKSESMAQILSDKLVLRKTPAARRTPNAPQSRPKALPDPPRTSSFTFGRLYQTTTTTTAATPTTANIAPLRQTKLVKEKNSPRVLLAEARSQIAARPKASANGVKRKDRVDVTYIDLVEPSPKRQKTAPTGSVAGHASRQSKTRIDLTYVKPDASARFLSDGDDDDDDDDDNDRDNDFSNPYEKTQGRRGKEGRYSRERRSSNTVYGKVRASKTGSGDHAPPARRRVLDIETPEKSLKEANTYGAFE